MPVDLVPQGLRQRLRRAFVVLAWHLNWSEIYRAREWTSRSRSGQDNFIQSISNFFAVFITRDEARERESERERGREREQRYRQPVPGSMCWDHPRDLNIFPINFNSFSSFSSQASVDVAALWPVPCTLSLPLSRCRCAVCLYLLDLNSQPHFHVRLSVFPWLDSASFQFDLLSHGPRPVRTAFCVRELKLNRIWPQIGNKF